MGQLLSSVCPVLEIRSSVFGLENSEAPEELLNRPCGENVLSPTVFQAEEPEEARE